MREDYMTVTGEMLTLELRCNRIVQERAVPSDRPALVEFGEKLWHWTRGDFNFPDKEETVLENLYRYQVTLRVKRRGRKEMGGFEYLMDIADVLKMAGNPEIFDGRARDIELFLGECRKEAEEIWAIGSGGNVVFETYENIGTDKKKV